MSTYNTADSIVEYIYGPPSGHRCGYCSNTSSSISQGMWAHTMSVQSYQDLIDRGWRRSGKYCYKPLMDKTCCPAYTIRCDALKFKASKSQKKVLKRVNKYLNTGVKCGDYLKDEAGMGPSDSEAALSSQSKKLQEKVEVDQQKSPADSVSNSNVNQCLIEKNPSPLKDKKITPSEKISSPTSDSKATPMDSKKILTNEKNLSPPKDKKTTPSEKISSPLSDSIETPMDSETMLTPGKEADPDSVSNSNVNQCSNEKNPSPLKDKKITPSEKISSPTSDSKATPMDSKKILTNEKNLSPPKDKKTTPSEKISSPLSDSIETPMDSETMLTPGKGADPTKPKCKKAKALRLEKRLHKQGALSSSTDQSKPVKNTEKTLREFLTDVSENPAHKLEVRLVRSAPRSPEFDASFDEAYAVYKKYQMTIHKDPPHKPTKSQYTRFLVESPLQEEHDNKLPYGYGSFHQQYLLDGKIIAVGVIDILPESISSVYLYYDPDFSFLCPGTYSALRETDFTCHLNSFNKNIQNYYMGFYIHSCPKMRYKGNYTPSYLLCPEVHSWHPYEESSPKLDAVKYTRFAPPGKEDTNLCGNVMNVRIFYNYKAINYGEYKLKTKANDEEEVQQYANYVGEKCANAMLLYRS